MKNRADQSRSYCSEFYSVLWDISFSTVECMYCMRGERNLSAYGWDLALRWLWTPQRFRY